MPAPAKPSAPAASAPASQRGTEAAQPIPGNIEKDQELTDLLLAELDEAPERPAEEATPAKPAKPAKPKPAADPEDADNEEEEEDPAGAEAATETEEEREERLQQQEGESAEDYAVRMAAEEEGKPAEETAEEREERLAQQEGETDEDYAARLAEEAPEGAADGKVSKGLQKRFKQLTDEKKALAAENTALKAKLEARPAQAAASSSLLAAIQAAETPAKLEQMRAHLEQWEEFALTNPDGAELPGAAGAEPVVYTKEQVRGLLVDARRGLREIPAQARFLEQAQAGDAAALKAFPAYADADSPLSKAYAAVVQRAPQLARAVPDLKLFVADAVRGRALRLKAAAGDTRPGRPLPRVATPPPAGRGAPARGKPAGAAKAQQAAAARARVEAEGGEDAVAAYLETIG